MVNGLRGAAARGVRESGAAGEIGVCRAMERAGHEPADHAGRQRGLQARKGRRQYLDHSAAEKIRGAGAAGRQRCF